MSLAARASSKRKEALDAHRRRLPTQFFRSDGFTSGDRDINWQPSQSGEHPSKQVPAFLRKNRPQREVHPRHVAVRL